MKPLLASDDYSIDLLRTYVSVLDSYINLVSFFFIIFVNFFIFLGI